MVDDIISCPCPSHVLVGEGKKRLDPPNVLRSSSVLVWSRKDVGRSVFNVWISGLCSGNAKRKLLDHYLTVFPGSPSIRGECHSLGPPKSIKKSKREKNRSLKVA